MSRCRKSSAVNRNSYSVDMCRWKLDAGQIHNKNRGAGWNTQQRNCNWVRIEFDELLKSKSAITLSWNRQAFKRQMAMLTTERCYICISKVFFYNPYGNTLLFSSTYSLKVLSSKQQEPKALGQVQFALVKQRFIKSNIFRLKNVLFLV